MKRWWCGMCEELFTRSGDCPLCGFQLERWPEDEHERHPDEDDGQTYGHPADELAERKSR